MEHERWLEGWRTGNTRFHREDVNTTLVSFLDRWLDGAPRRVLVPLCGKSVDLAWLAASGCDVVGAELSDIAVRALFEQAGVAPAVEAGEPELWRSPGLSVFRGDWFALTPAALSGAWSGTASGPVRVWDRAAMIALPPSLRGAYVQHLRSLAGPGAVVLLDTLSYDQAQMAGPPFAVPEVEVRAAYEGCRIEVLLDQELPVEERFAARGVTWFRQHVYQITLPG